MADGARTIACGKKDGHIYFLGDGEHVLGASNPAVQALFVERMRMRAVSPPRPPLRSDAGRSISEHG